MIENSPNRARQALDAGAYAFNRGQRHYAADDPFARAFFPALLGVKCEAETIHERYGAPQHVQFSTIDRRSPIPVLHPDQRRHSREDP